MDPAKFFDIILDHDIRYFAGVPDSTFQPMVNYLNTQLTASPECQVTHFRAVNECEAMALAAGYHLGSQRVGMVYMQNSGLGKTVNPLTSLLDKEVFSIPALLFIGWRGEPGAEDDPQHKKMGRIMLSMLDDLEVPYAILEGGSADFEYKLNEALAFMGQNSLPYALICKRGFFDDFADDSDNNFSTELTCKQVITGVMDHTDGNELLISTTGRLSRALHHLREQRGDRSQDFFTLGSMGCAGAIGLGLSTTTDKKVIVLDGDGAALMQMGTMASIGARSPPNFYHILIDNNAYCSTGCQPTISEKVDFAMIAKACGYRNVITITRLDDFQAQLPPFLELPGPSLLVAKVHRSRIKYLKRLQDPLKYKKNFQSKLNE